MAGTFIDVEVDESVRGDAGLAKQLEEACPVDIYKDAGGHVEVVEANLDECILCEMCVRAAPPGTVRVKKLYSGETLESTGSAT